MLGVAPDLLRDGEGWAVETFLRFGTHNSTHVDAPWHYNSTIGGERAQTIDELPLEWFHAPGVVLDFAAREDGDAIDVDDVEAELARIGHELAAAGHRPRAHRSRRLLRRARLHGPRPRASPPRRRAGSTSGACASWASTPGAGTAPLHLQAQEADESGEAGIFWAAHQADLRLLADRAPRATSARCRAPGFRVSCFPLRIVGASAAPARVVAILDD